MSERIRQLLSIEIRTDQAVVLARQRARQIAGLLGFDSLTQTKISTAMSEIARNAFRSAGGGQVGFALHENTHRRLVITVRNNGPGISDLSPILAQPYESPTGLGIGMVGSQRLMDEFDVVSTPGVGTVITFAKFLPPRTPILTRVMMDQLAASLAKGVPGDHFGEIQQQNQELLAVLDQLQQRQHELQILNRELEDTNRGVVALYGELDSRADLLRRTLEIRSRFLSYMTHEFRTPLNSILGLVNLLLAHTDGELTSEQEKQIGFIKRSAQGLSELVNDLLDIARVDAGKVTIKPTIFTVASLFGALKGVLRPLLPTGSAVSLYFDEPANPLILHTDEGKVSQVLRNFIANALKFTIRGEVRVSTTVLNDEYVRFSVADTGVGIEKADLKRVFEEFAQVENSTPQSYRSTGLGLHLSRRLAGILGGSVGVVSTPGIGSVFNLDIPRHAPATDAGELIGEPAQAIPLQRQPSLLIDDDVVSRYLIRTMVEDLLDLNEASSLAEGLAISQQVRPQVILVKALLSNTSVTDLLRLIRSEPTTARAHLLVYGVRALEETFMTQLSTSGAMVISSADPQALRTAICEALGRSSSLPYSQSTRHE